MTNNAHTRSSNVRPLNVKHFPAGTNVNALYTVNGVVCDLSNLTVAQLETIKGECAVAKCIEGDTYSRRDGCAEFRVVRTYKSLLDANGEHVASVLVSEVPADVVDWAEHCFHMGVAARQALEATEWDDDDDGAAYQRAQLEYERWVAAGREAVEACYTRDLAKSAHLSSSNAVCR